MFDTHAHVHDPAFDGDRDEMLARARAAGVARIMTIGTDVATSAGAIDVALRYGLDYAIGIHPHEAGTAPDDVAGALDALVAGRERGPRAVGEMGLDYYYDHSPREAQRRVLREQLRYAASRDLPAIFHQRDAWDDFFTDLRSHAGPNLRGIVHCFTGGPEHARVATDEFGLYLGIGGVLTFKSAQNVRDAVVAVGLDRLVLETDCPYLAPVPHRGGRNEPAYLTATAAYLATVLGVDAADVVARTTANARALLGD